MGIYSMFGFLAGPLGYIMEFMYNILKNYGWTIILFTFLVRVVMFPLSLKQQKSTARMAAFQPLIQEVQKKWPNDRNRQNEEMQKLYAEHNIKMSAGCLPMAVNMIVLFGMIAVIQAPMNYMLHVPADQIENGVEIVKYYDDGDEAKIKRLETPFTQQSILIGEINSRDPDHYEDFVNGVDVTGEDGTVTHVAMDAEWIDKVRAFNFEFLGFDLSAVPTLSLNKYLVLPILSVLTMFASQFIIMKTSGSTQQQGSMWVMTIVMGLFFGYYAFTVPVGFSLYYTVSNVVMTLQQLIVRRIHDPEKIKEEIRLQIEESKKAKKSKKTVALATADGGTVTQELTEKDLTRLRLERARQQDAERYGLDAAAPPADDDLDEFDDDEPVSGKLPEDADGEEAASGDGPGGGSPAPENSAENTEENAAEKPKKAAPDEAQEYKPGRRRRAKLKEKDTKEQEPASFAEKEMQSERKDNEREE